MTAPKIGNQNSITPDPGVWQSLYDDAGTTTSFGATALPASGAWRASEVFSVASARTLLLGVFYNAHASTVTGYPEFYIKVSNADSAPATGDDSWVELTIRDDTLQAAAAMTGTLPSGQDATAGPLRNPVFLRGILPRTNIAVANSDKIRQAFVFDVTPYRWCQVTAHEKGDTTNIGTLTLNASLSA